MSEQIEAKGKKKKPRVRTWSDRQTKNRCPIALAPVQNISIELSRQPVKETLPASWLLLDFEAWQLPWLQFVARVPWSL